MRSLLIAFCLTCCAGICLSAQQAGGLTPPPLPRDQAEIYRNVTSRVLAPCCWSQPVQFHQSDAATRVRAEVAGYVGQGFGQQEILDRLAAEYGERILGEPRGARATIALATPLIILAIGLAITIFAISRLARRQLQPLAYYTGYLPDISESEL